MDVARVLCGCGLLLLGFILGAVMTAALLYNQSKVTGPEGPPGPQGPQGLMGLGCIDCKNFAPKEKGDGN